MRSEKNGCRRSSINKMVSLRVKAVNIKHIMVLNSLVVSKSVAWYIVTNKLLFPANNRVSHHVNF
jgi:hypothetical protein